ncbi:uncharacterized protein [Diabrotica undecimpunctata]|uniref:uncharacterized protein isoform X1 n=1 Tax=Diabrotica undecimpunctata TaxID=50387 RepID=UPI003B641F4C
MATEVSAAPVTQSHPTCLESVNRFSKLPVVDSTIKTATSLYEKVKDLNGLTHWTFSTAETTLCKAVDLGMPIATPVIKNFEGPIKKVDNVLCSGLDYVEEKIPAVKLPTNEIALQIYNTTKDYVNNTITPAVETAKAYAEPAVKTAKDFVEPAYEMAKSAVEPTLERARHIVEPIVQPALDKANAIKENVMQRVDEYLHLSHQEGEVVECQECVQIRKRLEQQQQQDNQNEQQQQDQQPEGQQ